MKKRCYLLACLGMLLCTLLAPVTSVGAAVTWPTPFSPPACAARGRSAPARCASTRAWPTCPQTRSTPAAGSCGTARSGSPTRGCPCPDGPTSGSWSCSTSGGPASRGPGASISNLAADFWHFGARFEPGKCRKSAARFDIRSPAGARGEKDAQRAYEFTSVSHARSNAD